MATPMVMPKAGNSVEECLLTTWRVKAGDSVKAGDILADIETDLSCGIVVLDGLQGSEIVRAEAST
jgi:hypothetical protein